jgi:hypothetical protein
MGFNNTIILEDVIQVARELNFNPTLKQMDEVVRIYATEQESDLTATWNLVVEQILYSLEVEQIKPNES